MIIEHIKTSQKIKTIRGLAMDLTNPYLFLNKNIVGIIAGEKYFLRRLPKQNDNDLYWFPINNLALRYDACGISWDTERGMVDGYQEYLEVADKVFVLESMEDLKDFIDMDV